jgi:hypothetical protein
MSQSGEQNQAENLGSGEGLYSGRSGHYLQFKGLSVSNSLTLNSTGDTLTLGIDETQLDITNLMNFPLDINELGNVSGTPATGDVLIYSGSGWAPAIPPGATDFVYDGAGVDENYFLKAEEVLDIATGLSHSPKKWKWITKDKYMVADKLSGLPSSVTNIPIEKDLLIDYENIANSHVLTWAGTSWVAAAPPGLSGSGEVNIIGSWGDASLGSEQSSSGISLAAETVTLANGSTLDVSKRLTQLMVKTIVPTAYISVDTTVSNGKEIGFTIDETQLLLGNMGGTLDPSRISPGTVGVDEFKKLDGYTGTPIGSRFIAVEAELLSLETDKVEITVFQTHTDYDTTLRGTDYTIGYDPAVSPGNPNGQVTVADLGGMKRQPYEVGNILPVFNANKILNAPIDPTFTIADGSATGISTLTMDQGGKFLQWDGTQWTVGGGGEVSDGTHQQFAFYYSHSPSVSTDTQTLKPTGDAFVFIQGNGSTIESKVGMYTQDPPELFSISGVTPAIALKQISDSSNEPEVDAGWGKIYARSSAGGISAESVAVIHFDGASGGNAFLNDGNGKLFFLPKHDSNGNGVYDATNDVVTESSRYIYGGTAGYFPGGAGDYLAAPVPVGEIELLNKPFSFDFWFMPILESGETQLQGKQYICGQYQQAETYWYIAIDYDGAQHSFEFVWKEWDGAATATVHTRTLLRSNFGTSNFSPDTWYHIVLQRYPSGSTERFDLLVAEAVGQGFTGAPSLSGGGVGLPHLPYENQKVLMDIPASTADFLIGNFCRQENQGYGSFRGYIDEFRFQIGSYIDYVGLAYQNYYRTYLLPYDTGNSALVFKDDLGTHDLLNSAGVVRRLKDQDGDTTIDVDTGGVNDNHIRITTSAIEVANFSQSGMQLSNTDVRVSTIKNDLNNSYATALVTQKAIKEALDSISTKSIEDTAGTTFVHTEATINDYAIRMTVQNSEKIVIDSTSIDLKAPLKAYGTLGAEGEVLVVAADGSLEWGNPGAGNVTTGDAGTITMYLDNNDINLAPAVGLTWNNAAEKLTAKELKIQKLKIEEGISQPGLLKYRYSTGSGSWNHSLPVSSTNPVFPTEAPSVSVVPYIWTQTGSGFPHDSRSSYRARYTGFWHCQESGDYNFGLFMANNNLGCFFFIDGQLLIDATTENYNFVGCTFTATKGEIYAVEIARYGEENQYSFANCQFNWVGPSTSTSYDLTGIFQTHYPVLEAAGSKRDLYYTFEVPKVGIGTNEPTEALEVVGTIKANNFIGDFEGLNPTGAVIAYGGTTAPADWLLADGAAYSRSTYSNLYAVTGNAHGAGDGSTTFNVPDYNNSGSSGPQVYIIKT